MYKHQAPVRGLCHIAGVVGFLEMIDLVVCRCGGDRGKLRQALLAKNDP